MKSRQSYCPEMCNCLKLIRVWTDGKVHKSLIANITIIYSAIKYISINHRSIWSPNSTMRLVQAQKSKWSFFQSFFSQQRTNSGSEWVREKVQWSQWYNDLHDNFFDDSQCICYTNVLSLTAAIYRSLWDFVCDLYREFILKMHSKTPEKSSNFQAIRLYFYH